jgi:hypothetical protein
MGATKPALLRASAAAAVRGEVSVRRGDGGAGMRPDHDVAAAAQFALRVKGRMPDKKMRAALESLLGAEVVKRALADPRDDTNVEEEQDDDNKEEQGNDNGEDRFVVAQDKDTKDNETSSGKALKVQQASGRKAHQQTHEDAHHLTYRGGGMLSLSSDSNDGETRGSKVRPGSWPVNKDIKAWAPKARQGSLSSDAP